MTVADSPPPQGSVGSTARRLVEGFLLAFLPLAPLYAWDLAVYAYYADEAAVTSASYRPVSTEPALLTYLFIFASPFVAGLWLRGVGSAGAVLGMLAAAFAATRVYGGLLWLVYPAGTAPSEAESPLWVGASLLLMAPLVGIPCGLVGLAVGALAARFRRLRARSPSSAG